MADNAIAAAHCEQLTQWPLHSNQKRNVSFRLEGPARAGDTQSAIAYMNFSLLCSSSNGRASIPWHCLFQLKPSPAARSPPSKGSRMMNVSEAKKVSKLKCLGKRKPRRILPVLAKFSMAEIKRLLQRGAATQDWILTGATMTFFRRLPT